MVTPPDHRERTQALDPSSSFIVEAPAGSGKTTLLVQRILTLLAQVERPESVVAITFTRKAAAEMRERVVEALRDVDADAPADNHKQKMRELAHAVLQQDARKGWNLRSDSSRLQIQTIDSLCSLLTRQMPVVSQLGGGPEVMEHAKELYRHAARRTLRALAEGGEREQSVFRAVAVHFDSDLRRLEGQMADMLAKREQWRAFRNAEHKPEVQVFCDLLRYAEEQLRVVFQQAGRVDFTAITRAAIDALGTPEAPSDLLYWLDYRIEHLLVDEFQDTSFAQYQLLERLTGQWSAGDNRTLFLVGDPMQSIYGFREADVGLFLQCWQRERLGDVLLTPLRLLANFRSTPEIVDWAQTNFAPMMLEDNVQMGAVKMRPAQATRAQAGVFPSFTAFVDDTSNTAEAAEVVRVVEAAPNRGEVAILVRSRTHLTKILPALRNAGIPYEAIEIDNLQNQQHILDLLSLTRALLHTGDRAAWLACLRAPWCGLALADLLVLAEKDERSLFALLNDEERVGSLSLDGRQRVRRAGAVLSEAVHRVGRVPLRDLVQRTWMALGGPAVLTDDSQREDARTFLQLLEDAETGGTIRDFSLLNARLEMLFAQPKAGPDCVKVMTIHTAKGLEFDTVILPQLGRQTQRDENELLLWKEEIVEQGEEPRLRVEPQPQRGTSDEAYQAIKEEIREKKQHENKRLFYVAATRAKNRLHLLGNGATKQDGGLRKPPSDSFLGLLWPTVEQEFESVVRRGLAQKQRKEEEAAEPVTQLRRLPSSWALPTFALSVSWRPELESAAASARQIRYEWVSNTGRHVGTVVHEVLKRVAHEGAENWTAQRVEHMAPLFRSELQRLGVHSAEEAEAAEKIVRALRATLESKRGRWILKHQTEARSEWAVGGQLGTRIISGSVDRCFRDEKGRFWIVDYKTSEHQGGRLQTFLDEEQRRYREQLENYASVISKLVRPPIFLGLYFPLHDGWREWEFFTGSTTAAGAQQLLLTLE